MAEEKKKVGLLGCGAMGSAIVLGLVRAERYEAENISLFNRSPEKIEALTSQFNFNVANSIQDLFGVDILILATKPKDIDKVLKDLKGIPETTMIVSVLAGITISKLEAAFPKNPIVRVMPNTPCQIGKGASGLTANKNVNGEELNLAKGIFETIGIVAVVAETSLNGVTALSGSGPAYIFLMIEAMTEAGEQVGLDRSTAEKLAIQTVYGASSLVLESGELASSLRRKVTSPGGTTEAGIKSLEESNFKEIVSKAIKAASKRAEELA